MKYFGASVHFNKGRINVIRLSEQIRIKQLIGHKYEHILMIFFPYLKVLQYVSNLAVYRLCITWKQSAARLQSSFCCCFLKKVEIGIIYWRKWETTARSMKQQFHKLKQETGSSPCRKFYLRTGRLLSWWRLEPLRQSRKRENWVSQWTIPRKQGLYILDHNAPDLHKASARTCAHAHWHTHTHKII